MTDSDSPRGLLRTGRPLDEDGDPADGPALELDPESLAAELLRESPRPLVASPGAGTWATLLETPAEGTSDRPVLVQWLAPDAAEPPAHVHPTAETFEAVEGEFTVVVDGETTVLEPGESMTVDPGQEHAFRNDTGAVVAFRAKLPSMLTVRSLYTVWGLDQEGAFGADGEYGEPGLLQALVLSEDVSAETTVTMAPLTVQRVLWATLGTLARAMGYTGIDDRFLEDEFWKHHVEQPDL